MIDELSLKCLQNVIQVKLNKNYLDKITSKTGHYSSTPNIFSYGKKLFLGTVWGKTLVNGEHLQHARQVWDLRATGIYIIFQKKKRKKVTHSYSLVYPYFTNCCSAHYEKNSEICMWRSNFTELWSGTTGTLINSNLTGILNDQFSKTIATFSFLYVMFQRKHIIMILEHFNYEH